MSNAKVNNHGIKTDEPGRVNSMHQIVVTVLD